MKKAGLLWLQEHYQLDAFAFSHNSYIGNNAKIELTPNGSINQIYGPRYAPANDTVIEHLVFALKYDDINLSFLKAVFDRIPGMKLALYISSNPSGKYARKLGFLYEFTTQKQLDDISSVSGKYLDLLDQDKYVTSKAVKNARWKISDNLLGGPEFCPIVRKTPMMTSLLEWNISEAIIKIIEYYPEDIFKRAISYLYNKETRSSYAIERENPSPDRTERFIALLETAGRDIDNSVLEEKSLTTLQNAIVDPRFAARGFRDFQNYIGQTLPDFTEIIHYICPPPQYINSLMKGLSDCHIKSEGAPGIIRAAIISFGFVFFHPYDDGNGRIHRFLIHDTLVRDGIVPEGIIIPVSAYMLNNIKEYDQALENFSKPMMKITKFQKKNNEEIEILNPSEIESWYRFPDLTVQSIFLAQTIQATIKNDIPNELRFIQRYDDLKSTVQKIVDMPDKDINMIIVFVHQNHGIFPKRRRNKFEKLTDSEIHQIELAYREFFEM